MAIGQGSRSCAYTLYPRGVAKIEPSFTLWAVAPEIWADFSKIATFEHDRNLAIGQSSKYMYTLFLPQGVE